MPSGARCHPPAEWSGGFRPAWPPRSGPGCSPPSRCCLQSSPQPGPLEWPSHTESLPQSWSGLGREGCQWLETPGVGQGGDVDPRVPQRSTLTLTLLPSPLTGPAPTGGIPEAPTLLTQASFPPGGEWKGGFLEEVVRAPTSCLGALMGLAGKAGQGGWKLLETCLDTVQGCWDLLEITPQSVLKIFYVDTSHPPYYFRICHVANRSVSLAVLAMDI